MDGISLDHEDDVSLFTPKFRALRFTSTICLETEGVRPAREDGAEQGLHLRVLIYNVVLVWFGLSTGLRSLCGPDMDMFMTCDAIKLVNFICKKPKVIKNTFKKGVFLEEEINL